MNQSPTDAELNEKLADHLKPRLREAVDALLAGSPESLQAFLADDKEKSEGGFPDLWREAAAHLFKCDPTAVNQRMRFAVKHSAYFLLHGETWEDSGERAKDTMRDLLRVLGAGGGSQAASVG